MKAAKKEQGYTLFLVILIVVLFGVLATSLLTLTVSGAKRNAIREDVTKATELSEKGLQHIIQHIQKEISDEIENASLGKDEFILRFETILNKYLCDEGTKKINPISAKEGNYTTCIETYENQRDGQGQVNRLKKKITFLSTGRAKKHDKETRMTVELGTSTVPEVLNYAVGTNISSPYPKNGEGNLLLHGGVEITGDLKVDGNLITHHRGTGAYQWLNSIRPRVNSLHGNQPARLVIGKNMYTLEREPYTQGNETSHANYLNRNHFNNNNYALKTHPEDLFDSGHAPVIVKREPGKTNIDIVGQKGLYYYNQHGATNQFVVNSNNRIISNKNETGKAIPYIQSYDFWGRPGSPNFNAPMTLQGRNSFESLSLLGGATISSGSHTISEGLYVGSGLTIGHTNRTSPSGSVEIDGRMYIDGDVKIQGINLKANAMLYVDGNVEIRHSTIEGLKKGNKTGSLIIFATGDIFIANISENLDSPSDINGYFYSEGFLELYGVGSNVRIKGGISANRVVLNAVRGKVRTARFNGYSNYVSGVGYYQSSNHQRYEPSRLQIIYDPDLIENYLNLNPPQPVIKDLDLPKILGRD